MPLHKGYADVGRITHSWSAFLTTGTVASRLSSRRPVATPALARPVRRRPHSEVRARRLTGHPRKAKCISVAAI